MMTWQQSNEFNSMLREASWLESKGDSYMADKYYDEAARWYLSAANECRRAYDFARSCDDYSAQCEASSLERSCESKRQDAIYSGWSR